MKKITTDAARGISGKKLVHEVRDFIFVVARDSA